MHEGVNAFNLILATSREYTQQAIWETSLSRQSVALVLTTKQTHNRKPSTVGPIPLYNKHRRGNKNANKQLNC